MYKTQNSEWHNIVQAGCKNSDAIMHNIDIFTVTTNDVVSK